MTGPASSASSRIFAVALVFTALAVTGFSTIADRSESSLFVQMAERLSGEQQVAQVGAPQASDLR